MKNGKWEFTFWNVNPDKHFQYPFSHNVLCCTQLHIKFECDEHCRQMTAPSSKKTTRAVSIISSAEETKKQSRATCEQIRTVHRRKKEDRSGNQAQQLKLNRRHRLCCHDLITWALKLVLHFQSNKPIISHFLQRKTHAWTPLEPSPCAVARFSG